MADTKRQPKSETLDDLEQHMEQRRLEQAVIEAVRAWANAAREEFEWAELHQKVVINPHLKRMFDTVEALDKAGAGDE